MRFSVIIPIYNVEKYLRQCVDSLISQEYADVEIIMVDDGSPDNCPQICDEYAKQDARIKVVHKKNGGLVSARQAGCAVATGEYVLNVDGDDWVCPDYFKTLERTILKGFPDIVFFGANYLTPNGSIPHPGIIKTGFYDRQFIENTIFPYLIEDKNGRYFSPSIWSKAIKLEIYKKCQMELSPKIKIGEDSACTKPAIFYAQSISVVQRCLYCYRYNPTSMTKERKSFAWDGPELIGRTFEKQIDLKQFDFQEQIYRNVVHNLFNVVVSQFYRKEKLSIIIKDIRINLNHDYYRKAVDSCQFSNKESKLACFLLKHRWYLVIWMYSKIQKKIKSDYVFSHGDK